MPTYISHRSTQHITEWTEKNMIRFCSCFRVTHDQFDLSNMSDLQIPLVRKRCVYLLLCQTLTAMADARLRCRWWLLLPDAQRLTDQTILHQVRMPPGHSYSLHRCVVETQPVYLYKVSYYSVKETATTKIFDLSYLKVKKCF